MSGIFESLWQVVYSHKIVVKYSRKITVWCSLDSFKLLGPFFYEDEMGNAVTVTREHYSDMLPLIFYGDSTEINA